MPKLGLIFIFSSFYLFQVEQFLCFYSKILTKKILHKLCTQCTTIFLERCLIKSNKTDAFGSLI